MLYLSICSIIWGFSYGLIKGHLTGISPDLVACFRMLIPFLCFLPFLKLKSLSLKEIFFFFLIGAVQYGGMYLCFIRSYQYLAAYQIVLFCACTPIYVALIDDLLSKKFRLFCLITALMAFLGCAFLYYHQFSLSTVFKGFLLVQASDLCFAFGQVAYKRFKSKKTDYTDKSIYALLFFGGTVITALSTSIFGGWGHLPDISLKQSVVLLYLGAVASGLCFFWWNRAAVMISSGTLAVFNNVKIPLGVCLSIVFFGEKANVLMVVLSLLFIGTSLVLSEAYARKNSVFLKKKVAPS